MCNVLLRSCVLFVLVVRSETLHVLAHLERLGALLAESTLVAQQLVDDFRLRASCTRQEGGKSAHECEYTCDTRAVLVGWYACSACWSLTLLRVVLVVLVVVLVLHQRGDVATTAARIAYESLAAIAVCDGEATGRLASVSSSRVITMYPAPVSQRPSHVPQEVLDEDERLLHVHDVLHISESLPEHREQLRVVLAVGRPTYATTEETSRK